MAGLAIDGQVAHQSLNLADAKELLMKFYARNTGRPRVVMPPPQTRECEPRLQTASATQERRRVVQADEARA